VRRVHRRSIRLITVPGFAGARRHMIRVYEYTRTGFARRTTRFVYGCDHAARSHR
jgi:hypothetical protein